MQTKLTLRLDERVVRKAKRYSKKTGKSLSKLVSDYFAAIDAGDGGEESEVTPRVRSLFGALAESNVSEENYRRHLEEKHR